MRYTIQERPYTGKDYTVRHYNTLEEVHTFVKKEGCTVPCTYSRAGLVVYDNGNRVECWTTPHMVAVLENNY